MKKIAIAALAAAALFATAGPTSAQVYIGPGYGVHIGPRYDDQERYYRRDREGYGERRYYRQRAMCPRGYVVRYGRCRPYYRGY